MDIIQERREAKASENKEPGPKSDARTKGCAKLLWRAFQFAFRVYTFAGGHDDRADKLTRELAHEIENDPHHQWLIFYFRDHFKNHTIIYFRHILYIFCEISVETMFVLKAGICVPAM